MSAQPIFIAENITLRRAEGFQLTIPHLELAEGGIYGLVGPNGAGKSTFLRVVNLLEPVQSGTLTFRGTPVAFGTRQAVEVRRAMTMVMENPRFFHGSVFKNLTLGLRFRGVPRSEWPARIRQALDMVGLSGVERKPAHALSRGETQRVALARAIALRPTLLLLDEPFAHIDRRDVRTIESLLVRLNREWGMTLLFTTHDLWQASRLADQVFSLVDGKLVNGSLENLFRGEVVEEDNRAVRIASSVTVRVATPQRGSVHLLIPPQDIILSRQPFESSARNVFRGTIRQIHLEGSVVRVHLEIAGEVHLVALITRTSLDEMQLTVGMEIFLTFKSTAVQVF